MRTPDFNVAGERGQGCPALTEEYLSIAELAKRIPYAAQTIRNLMGRGEFRRDVHYLKPRGRVIFRWSAVQAWIEGQRSDADRPSAGHHAPSRAAVNRYTEERRNGVRPS